MKTAFLVLIIPLLFFSCLKTNKKASVGPLLQFMDQNLDLGAVKQGETARKTFQIKNAGDGDLVIKNIVSTCGCTAAMVDSKVLAPGEKGNLNISIDTSGKRDVIEKTITITTNEIGNPVREMKVTVKVSAESHPDFDVNKSVFSPACDKCHIGKAEQYKGYTLYMEICGMCHGPEGEGGAGSKLNDPDYLASVDNAYLFQWIAEGELGTSMPAYSKKRNGPLTDKQIESLVETIRSWE